MKYLLRLGKSNPDGKGFLTGGYMRMVTEDHFESPYYIRGKRIEHNAL